MPWRGLRTHLRVVDVVDAALAVGQDAVVELCGDGETAPLLQTEVAQFGHVAPVLRC